MILAIGGQMVSSGSISIGDLSSFLLYTIYAGSSISGLSSFYSELMKGVGAASRIFELLDREPSIKTTGISISYSINLQLENQSRTLVGLLNLNMVRNHPVSTNTQFNLHTQRDLWLKFSKICHLRSSQERTSPSSDLQGAESLP